MNLPLTFLPPAEWDILSAYSHYKEEDTELGVRFLEELGEFLDRVQANPYLYALVGRDKRAVPMRKFPYVVYYKVRIEDILIVGVVHGRRHRRSLRGRA